ncbi:LCP family protein [Butyrivibrio sp. XPD2002]|uniref:LCP family protein n=1 Tax=Butyrivibrio sp. XPD2002 TaxID=1280665 RepID=UPI0003F95842|nr:LCP family protein [Butyrivibrio sp. XPD2002]
MRNRVNKILLIWCIVVTLILVGLGAFEVTRVVGKSGLFAKNAKSAPVTTSTEVLTQAENAMQWQDDWIKHDGVIYDYNEDIMTFLVMGIDKTDEEVTPVYGEINGGQADALFLLVFNPHNETTTVIGINRNTMTDVEMYDEYGNYVNTIKAQIAVQHGFGDGVEGSCDLEKRAVSNLFYQLPIHGYAAINMSAIPTINDEVGGVDVTPTFDFASGDYEFKAGETVHLDGDAAFAFLQNRDLEQIGSADKRLARQKVYLTAFIRQVIETTKSQPTLAVDIYKAISKQMVTDVSVDQLSYIASTVAGYDFNEDSLKLLKGETRLGEKFEEFYPDQNELYELFLDTFYEKVDVQG